MQIDNEDAFTFKKSQKFIPPLLEQRMRIGHVKPNEFDKYFPLDKRDIEKYSKSYSAAKGNCGIIFPIEDCLININEIYVASYKYLIDSLYGNGESSVLSNSKIVDVIGRPFRDSISALGFVDLTKYLKWDVIESKFYSIFTSILSNYPTSHIFANSNAINLLDALIKDYNSIVISTTLPKSIAMTLLGKAGITNYLKGRVSSNNLLCYNEIYIPDGSLINYNNINYDNLLMKSCYILQLNPSVVVYISSNSKNILNAKRLGLNAIAVKGSSMSSFELRVADKVLTSLDDISANDIYKIIHNHVVRSQGPSLQPEVTMSRSLVKLKSVSAPGISKPREKDTFAKEYGSDLN